MLKDVRGLFKKLHKAYLKGYKKILGYWIFKGYLRGLTK
jgi:hypothetical protein